MALKLRDARVRLGDNEVLRGAGLSVAPGCRVALLGANGAGKSTLLLALAGAVPLRSGTVELDGEPLGGDRRAIRAHRRRVQLVVQDPDDQLLSADVEQDVSFGPLNLGLPEAEVRRRVEEALEVLGISHLAGRATHQLSYGERKRVTCAGAVALQPDYLLLDEPTAGLDASGVAGLTQALQRLHAMGTAVVVATHDVAFANGWADHVAVLAGGRVAQTPHVVGADRSGDQAEPGVADGWGPAPGLPDAAFANDGLVTKRHLRASALAHLRPRRGELLWDVGAGAGSIAIEWCRAAQGCRALAVERHPERAARARDNAARLAPGGVDVVLGDAEPTIVGWRSGVAPDAVFIGGGCSGGVIDECVTALAPGGRIVAHGVTVETELALLEAHRRHGGELARIGVEHLEPLASWHSWKPARTVLAWSLTK